jgi:hypothetical protein
MSSSLVSCSFVAPAVVSRSIWIELRGDSSHSEALRIQMLDHLVIETA